MPTNITPEAREAAMLELKDSADWIPGHDRPNPYGFHVQQLLDQQAAEHAKELAALDAALKEKSIEADTMRKHHQNAEAALSTLQSELDAARKKAFMEILTIALGHHPEIPPSLFYIEEYARAQQSALKVKGGGE